MVSSELLSLKLLCIMQRNGNGFTMGMKKAPN